MTFKKFVYTDRTFLNRLVMHLSSEVRFNALLQPDIKELLEVYEDFPRSPRDEQIEEVDMKTRKIIEVCKQKGILPFYGLSFEYHDWKDPFPITKMYYAGPNLGTGKRNEPYRSSNNPLNFLGNKRYYAVNFSGVQGEKNHEEAKMAIKAFLEEGYIMTDLSGELRPWEQAGEYIGRSGDDGSFYARNGRIDVFGKTEFFPNLPKEITKELRLLEDKVTS